MTTSDPAYSVVIPVYNEEQAIGGTLESLRAHGILDQAEVIVVNDGSTDRTAEVVAAFPVTLVRHRVNKGYGASLKTGIRRARASRVVIMDSDGQHSAEAIPQLLAGLDECPMVIGERDAASQVAARQFGKWIIRRVGELLVEQRLPDYNSGFRAFDRRRVMAVLHLLPNGFSLTTTVTLAFLKLGYGIGTIPIQAAPRVGRRSSVKPLRDGVKTLLLLTRIIMLFNPLKIFLPASLAVGLWGVLLGISDIWQVSRVSNGAVTLMVFAMFLFFFGLLADQISMLNLRERDESAP